MESKNPTELIEKVQQEQQKRSELAADALQWFLDGNVQELFPRSDVADELCEELDITEKEANTAISDTVGDIVDPVQQVVNGKEKYVGVIDYKIFNDEGAYGYIDFDDLKGERKRVVCAKCVEDCTYDSNVNHATQGEGTSNVDATWQQLLNKVTSHYVTQHSIAPSSIKPGASLLSDTTISGNTAFHQGNENLISHDSISGVGASDHHSKTTSASELTDVSSDSSSNAHHSKTTSASELTDVSSDSNSNAHHAKTPEYTDADAQSAVNTFSGSHNDLTNIGSNDHHSKTTSASELTDVSADSNSNAHHSKTTSVSELGGIIVTNDNAALGQNAGNENFEETAIGFEAAGANTDDSVVAAGNKAARNNSGFGVAATGDFAARNNSGDRVVALGYQAAKTNDGKGVIAIGSNAAVQNNQDDIMIITDRFGNRRMEFDLDNGNLVIEGSVTENATLKE
jgi:hypothetical protein